MSNDKSDESGSGCILVIGLSVLLSLTCDIKNRQQQVKKQVDWLVEQDGNERIFRTTLDDRLRKMQDEFRIENVIGGLEPEKFYKINGKNVYLEIDGKPVEEYFKK